MIRLKAGTWKVGGIRRGLQRGCPLFLGEEGGRVDVYHIIKVFRNKKRRKKVQVISFSA
jgi:hypothetical protein